MKVDARRVSLRLWSTQRPVQVTRSDQIHCRPALIKSSRTDWTDVVAQPACDGGIVDGVVAGLRIDAIRSRGPDGDQSGIAGRRPYGVACSSISGTRDDSDAGGYGGIIGHVHQFHRRSIGERVCGKRFIEHIDAINCDGVVDCLQVDRCVGDSRTAIHAEADQAGLRCDSEGRGSCISDWIVESRIVLRYRYVDPELQSNWRRGTTRPRLSAIRCRFR